MTVQYSTGVRDAFNNAFETTTGTSAKLRFYTGAMPATPATAASGTLIIEMALPSDWMNNSSSGTKTLLGTWTGTVSAAGSNTAGYYRIVDNAGTTCHEQGTIGTSVALTTNALTAANGNVLNFAATTGVVAGMNVAGTGIPTTNGQVTVLAVTSTTVTLSHATIAGVANTTPITFSYDLPIDNPVLANGQTVNVTTKSMIAPNA